MPDFRLKRYRIPSPKVASPVRICFLTDWHAGGNNLTPAFLMEQLENENPDVVLIGGDMATASCFESLKTADRFLREAGRRWPVFYARGNHEGRLMSHHISHKRYVEFEHRIASCGVCLLRNNFARIMINGQAIDVYGYNIPRGYYRKPFTPKLSVRQLYDALGTPAEDCFSILLAHTPMYARQYFAWGADLTLCGHYHGGVIRLTEHSSVISPQLRLFPAWSVGDFHHGSQTLITGAGLGEHGFTPGSPLSIIPLRYHNPRELITIDLEGAGN